MTNLVRKGMRRTKNALGVTNLQIHGEHELDDMATNDPRVLGRIDIVLQFLHQFGNENAYVAVECKRLRPGDATLNARYVSQGVDRFVAGRYAARHECAFMLGYLLGLPPDQVIDFIDQRIRTRYGEAAALERERPHPQSVAVFVGSLVQEGGHDIWLRHVFVDMLPAGP